MFNPSLSRAALVLALAAIPLRLAAQEKFDVRANYTKTSHMIPMRDGVKLFTIVYTPKDSTRTYPIMLFRTPYSIPPYGPDEYKEVLGPSAEFDRDGYIFVFQDVRGKFRSEGDFVVMKPYLRDKKGKQTDESSDTYDTIEWLLKNARPNNGRVGMWGISYPGLQVVYGMLDPHPALKAVSPQASPSDLFLGDDFYHNGAFRLMYAFSWLAGNAKTRSGQSEQRDAPFSYGTPDGYEFFMRVGAVGKIDSMFFQGRVPAWNDLVNHGTWDDYWQSRNMLRVLDRVPAQLPVLNVAGWFDAEDFFGPTSIYYTLEKLHPQNRSIVAIGPWLHGGWMRMDGDELGNIRFGSKTSKFFQQNIQFPFFQYYLKDRGTLDLPEAYVFETGSNVWRRYDRWPPPESKEKSLYFGPNGTLSFEPVAQPDSGFDAYLSDPRKPVPFSMEPRTTQGHLWMVEDQRFAARRPDVLVYETEPLKEDVTIAGPVLASLNVSTTGTDGDWVVKLIDVYPGDAPDNEPNPAGVRMGDFQMLVSGEVMRAKFRKSYSEPAPMVPGQVTPLEFDMRDKFHTFRKGHRIMVQVQSSWFPVIDRNPQVFTDIMHARDSDFRAAGIRVYRTPEAPSRLRLRVIERPNT